MEYFDLFSSLEYKYDIDTTSHGCKHAKQRHVDNVGLICIDCNLIIDDNMFETDITPVYNKRYKPIGKNIIKLLNIDATIRRWRLCLLVPGFNVDEFKNIFMRISGGKILRGKILKTITALIIWYFYKVNINDVFKIVY